MGVETCAGFCSVVSTAKSDGTNVLNAPRNAAIFERLSEPPDPHLSDGLLEHQADIQLGAPIAAHALPVIAAGKHLTRQPVAHERLAGDNADPPECARRLPDDMERRHLLLQSEQGSCPHCSQNLGQFAAQRGRHRWPVIRGDVDDRKARSASARSSGCSSGTK
jgi:hypothetical protein